MTIAREQAHGYVRSRVDGDIDMASAPLLREELQELAQGDVPVLLDLTGTPFVDSLGLSVLVTAVKRFRDAGVPLAIAAPGPRVREIVDVTGLASVLPLFPSEAAALEHLGRRPT